MCVDVYKIWGYDLVMCIDFVYFFVGYCFDFCDDVIFDCDIIFVGCCFCFVEQFVVMNYQIKYGYFLLCISVLFVFEMVVVVEQFDQNKIGCDMLDILECCYSDCVVDIIKLG